jgi:hypothetical protein
MANRSHIGPPRSVVSRLRLPLDRVRSDPRHRGNAEPDERGHLRRARLPTPVARAKRETVDDVLLSEERERHAFDGVGWKTGKSSDRFVKVGHFRTKSSRSAICAAQVFSLETPPV